MRFLLFTLYAPMGSFGEIAVGERRMSWSRPGRSAVLGLVAAAQGIERTDEAAHHRLETSLHYAVRTDAPGRPLLDYHTVQTPKARRGRTFATRRQELASDDLNTVLSSREWRSDAYFTVALWARPDRAVDLSGIASALQRPRFVLYVGRKSAPLGLPLNPEIIEADGFVAAFHARHPNEEERNVLQRIHVEGVASGMIAFDHDAPGVPADVRIGRRRDAVLSRSRWQFADRLEAVVVPESSQE
jgi:CRISPR system Cascade subunit CasD